MMGLFVQDSWKVTRKLTLDYGPRYDYQTYLKEQYGRMADASVSTFNPTVGRLRSSTKATVVGAAIASFRTTIPGRLDRAWDPRTKSIQRLSCAPDLD
jgi:hypothetical protein